jgi:hypothetical protein
MDTILTNHVIDLIAALVQAVLLGLVAYGFALLRSKVKDDKINNALGLVQDAVNTTVRELNQLLVKDLKASNGGKLTQEQIEELKVKSINLVYEKLTDPTVQLLDAAYSNIDNLIQSMVQARIDEIKSQPTSTPSPGN